jgi:hypothetical protein
MVSYYMINLKDVSWWMSIKNAYKPKVPLIVKLSKEGCISLTVGKRPSCAGHKYD